MSMHRVASVPQQGRRTTRLDDVLTAGLSRGFRSGVTISAPEENNNTNNTKQQADKLHQLEEKLKECHERVAQYLEAASKDAANSNEKAAMAEAAAKRNVIPQLVAAVRDGTDTQKEDAAGELWTLAVGNPFNRAAIKSARGIPPLVELVRNGTTDKQKKHAAGALQSLARYDTANQVAIAAAGGIPPLVELVRNGTEMQKEYAALALMNLSLSNTRNQEAIADANGIQPLVVLVRDGTDMQKQYAEGALEILNTNNNDITTRIEEAIAAEL